MNELGALLQGRLLQERRDGFAKLQGLRLTGSLPITSAALTALILGAQPQGDLVARVLKVNILGNNAALAELTIDRWPLPKRAEVGILLTSTVATAQRPVLTGVLEVGGLLGAVVPVLSGLLSRPGLTFQGKSVELNLAELLRASGNGDLLPLLRRLELRTEPGRLWVDFDLAVD